MLLCTPYALVMVKEIMHEPLDVVFVVWLDFSLKEKVSKERITLKVSNVGVPQWLSGLRICVAMGCGIGHRCGLDLAWLRCRLAAVALIGPLAWELPYASGEALKRQKKKKKTKKKKLFYFEIVFNLWKSYKDNKKSSCMFFTQLLLISHLT